MAGENTFLVASAFQRLYKRGQRQLGFLGGLVIAWFIIKRGRNTRASADAFSGEPLSTDVINMARIRVAGVGGLGLVAMALVIALALPRIGQSLALGLVLGAVFAGLLILRRRRHGPMPSSGRRAGANTTLSIDQRPPSADEQDHKSSNVRTHDAVVVPGHRLPHFVTLARGRNPRPGQTADRLGRMLSVPR